jgi:gag-polypeptide of LTR copia-type
MASEYSVSKTIRLTDLVPDNYRLWAAQTEATFNVHGVWDIVLGQRLRPPPDDAPPSGSRSTRASPLTEDAKWDRQHALARQALLACLPPSELTKVYQLGSASEIWTRLSQEHGAISTARRAVASRNFYQLLMAPSGTTIQAHITTFTSRLQDLNYNLDAPLLDIDVNVAFLASLGSSWQTFQQSMGERVNTLKPAQLYAEVLAFESQRGRTEMAEKAIGNVLGYGNGNGNGEKTANFTRRNGGHGRIEKRCGGGFQKGNREDGHWDGFDKRKFCNYCKKNGHLIDECFKLLWKKQIAEDEEGPGDNYKPALTGGSMFGKH